MAEREELKDKQVTLFSEIAEIDAEIKALNTRTPVPSEAEDERRRNQIRNLENQRGRLGIFSGKEKKRITEEIALLNGRRDYLRPKIEDEKKARKAETDLKLAPLQAKKAALQSQIDAAGKRIDAIAIELAKDPESEE